MRDADQHRHRQGAPDARDRAGAATASGAVKPNPVVGAVVARDGEILGEGWHERVRRAHAEVNAIEACGARGSEPARRCTCRSSRAATRARRRRAPRRSCRPASGAWSSPPTIRPRRPPAAASASCATRASRWSLADGELAARARLLNQAFRKHARVGRPWVLFKSAMTLDGKVATRTGDSKWISGEDSRELAHRWRASVDAVVVGIGTALADDPQLTARPDGALAERREPAAPRRVRLARAPAAQLAARRRRRGDPARRSSSRGRPRAPTPTRSKPPASQVLVATGENEPARVRSALDQLGAQGVTSVLLEGGPHLAGAFLDAGEIDEIRLFLAPLLLGGSAARDPLEGEGVERISEALRALTFECESVGEDLLISARLREW